MNRPAEPPTCRDATIVTGFILTFGVVLFAIGLTMINRNGCSGFCETAGLTFLYAGGPISAVLGVFSDTVVAAWPVDVTVWVIVGFGVSRWATSRGKRPLGVALVVVLLALLYGLVLSQFVELTV